MSNHHFHLSAGPFTVLLFYYFISIRFQAEVFASRVAKPECRTTIFTGRPDRLLFYYFMSIRFQAEVFASRVAKPECRTAIFTGFSRGVFASRTAFFACRLTLLHVGQTYPLGSLPELLFPKWKHFMKGPVLESEPEHSDPYSTAFRVESATLETQTVERSA